MLKAILGILIGIWLVWWIRVFWFGEVFSTNSRNEPNRKALTSIYDCISVNSSRADVLACYYRNRTDDLRLLADIQNEWIVRIPMELGAKDWCLRIDFDDDKVMSVRIRTSDGPKPNNSLPDKNAPNKAVEGMAPR